MLAATRSRIQSRGEGHMTTEFLDEFEATDPAMQGILQLLKQIGPTSLPVLFLGESGSGKEVLAERLHRASSRAERKLLKVNCAGLTDTMVESELFGHERGAFTGALQAHPGLFELANGGSLFLDEIGELPLRTQAKLLRVLETGEFVRVGGTRPRTASCRLVSATHRDLPAMITRGEFRGDLYFRLRGVTIEVPPLRARPSEILPLARMFMQRSARACNRRDLVLASDAEAALLGHPWPGNVRELRHAIELGVAMSMEGKLTARSLEMVLRPGEPRTSEASGGLAALGTDDAATRQPRAGDERPRDIRYEMRAYERLQIRKALNVTGGNQTSAARLLGISRRTLCKKLRAHGFGRQRGAINGRDPECGLED